MSKKVLLIYGSGASSGFMVTNMRKVCLDIKIQARSEAELSDYANDVDALMVGPYLKVEFNAMKNWLPEKVKDVLMKPDYYSILDGTAEIEYLEKELKQ